MQWKKFEDPRPYTSVIGLIFGPDGKFPIMHRSPLVRSAKNAWSLPSGLHEVGLTMEQQFVVEAKEELGIEVIPESVKFVTCYEAILPEDQWHWVLHLFVAFSEDTNINNKEPDKHDIIERVSLSDIYKYSPWTKGLFECLDGSMPEIFDAATQLGIDYGFVLPPFQPQ